MSRDWKNRISRHDTILRQKIKRLPIRSGISVRPALVYDGELAPSVEGRGFFDAIIPAHRLLGLPQP